MDDDAGNDLAAKGDLAGGGRDKCSQPVADRLANEEIEKDKLGRKMAVVFASVMGLLCIFCIVFALWTGYHFLYRLDDVARQADVTRQARALIKEMTLTQTTQGAGELKVASGAVSISTPSKDGDEESISNIAMLAPLIPATFSSALGLLILVTLARFISNFILSDKKNPPKDQDYGAIAVLVKEIGSVVSTLRGKDK